MSKLHTFKFEPIVDQNDNIFAYEMLTVFENEEKHKTFSELQKKDKVTIFTEQINTVKYLSTACIKNIFLSVNVNTDIGGEIINSASLMHRISELSEILRIEIHEDFCFELNHPDEVILRKLEGLCPLWLDDFGSGNTSFTALQNYRLENIKLDKEFFWKNEHDISLIRFISEYAESQGAGMIIEGIDSEKRKSLLKKYEFHGGQGFLWKDVYIDDILRKYCHSDIPD